ncbi:MAG: O-antigen ligase family protein [Acidobacteria bacterium]|nr:O-antigen ligase family protein [Acidobacteriota bacterium]
MSTNTLATTARTRNEWLASSRRSSPASRLSSDDAVATPASASMPSIASWGRRFIVVILLGWVAGFAISFEFALTFLNVAAFVAAVAGVRWPSIGLLGIGVLSALEPITGPLLANGGLWRWNNLNYWLLVVLVLFLPVVVRFHDVHSRALQTLMLLVAAGLFVSPDLVAGSQYVLALATAFGVLLYCVRASQDREAWYWLGVVTGVLSAVGCLIYFLRRDVLQPLNPNVWCLFPLTALFAICVAFRLAVGMREHITLGLLAAVNFTWVFLTASRGGFVTGSLCMLFLFVQLPGVSRKIYFTAFVALIGLGVLSQFPDFQERALSRVDETLDPTKSRSDRTNNRSDLALAGWRIFEANPLGVGTGGFSRAQSQLGLFAWSRQRDYAAHSGWIRILAENGVPGMIALTVYVISFAVVGWRQRRRGMLKLGLLVTSVFVIMLVTYEFERP